MTGRNTCVIASCGRYRVSGGGAVAGPGPLSGCTVVVTALSADLAESLRWRGATVLHVPTMRVLPAADENGVAESTLRVLANPPDDVVVTTATGFRHWLSAAAGAGLA